MLSAVVFVVDPQQEDRAMDGRPAGWSIRPYQPGDETELVALFAQVFGRAISVDHWHWKLKGRPAPVENVWVAVADDGRVIGQYAGIPVQVQLGGRPAPAMVSVDTMTAPDFRRRGILTTLGAAIYASWRAAGVAAVLGLPNQQWGSRTTALGWTTLFPLRWLRCPLHIERALARPGRLPTPLIVPARAAGGAMLAAWHPWRRGSSPRRGLDVRRLAIGAPELDVLWTRLAPTYESLLVRDRAWVDWRYGQAPGLDYQVLLAHAGGEPRGYLAYRCAEARGRTTGYIADLFTAPDDPAPAAVLLGAALDDLWDRGAETARAPAAPRSPLEQTLRAAGFRPAPGAFDFEIVPLAPAAPVAALGDPARWLLTGG